MLQSRPRASSMATRSWKHRSACGQQPGQQLGHPRMAERERQRHGRALLPGLGFHPPGQLVQCDVVGQDGGVRAGCREPPEGLGGRAGLVAGRADRPAELRRGGLETVQLQRRVRVQQQVTDRGRGAGRQRERPATRATSAGVAPSGASWPLIWACTTASTRTSRARRTSTGPSSVAAAISAAVASAGRRIVCQIRPCTRPACPWWRGSRYAAASSSMAWARAGAPPLQLASAALSIRRARAGWSPLSIAARL